MFMFHLTTLMEDWEINVKCICEEAYWSFLEAKKGGNDGLLKKERIHINDGRYWSNHGRYKRIQALIPHCTFHWKLIAVKILSDMEPLMITGTLEIDCVSVALETSKGESSATFPAKWLVKEFTILLVSWSETGMYHHHDVNNCFWYHSCIWCSQ